jgi:MinD-like ATPase involved in chromosome partitioning or flagellar assembly
VSEQNDNTGSRPLQRGWDDRGDSSASSQDSAVRTNGTAVPKPSPSSSPTSSSEAHLSRSLGWPLADHANTQLPWLNADGETPPETPVTGPSGERPLRTPAGRPAAEPWRLGPAAGLTADQLATREPPTVEPSARSQRDERPETSAPVQQPSTALAFDTIVTRRSARPTTGWRAAVYGLTAGRWNPGPSAAERAHLEKISKIKTLLPGRHVVTVTSMKGGIGKTTSAALLGLALAEHRGDQVIALDANPDAGTLAERLLGVQPLRNVRDLLANADRMEFSSDLARVTSLAGRLQVLASEQDPVLSEGFTDVEYRRVVEVLRRFCNVIITDTGTGLVHSAMQGALAESHSLIVTGAPTADGASLASRTLDWLEKNGYEHLVKRAIVVLSCDRVSRDINMSALRAHFQGRCRAVVEIPRDPHLAKGQQIDLSELRPRTLDAAMTLAALVAEQFREINDSKQLGREHG